MKTFINILILALFFISSISSFSQNELDGLKLKTIAIDPGHGGKDPGAVSKKGYEKDLVLDIGLRVGDYINKLLPDVKVVYTRKTDVFIELAKRAEIANEAKADLLISIHANANKSSTPSGTETYVLGLHRTKENFELAMRENSVILIEDNYAQKYEGFDPNSPESYIIFSLLQNVYFDHSLLMASRVQDQFRERAKRTDRGVKQLGLLVLARASMPSILIEVGFISNPDEAAYLFTEEGKDHIASAIYRAIREYKDMYEGLVDATIKSKEDVNNIENKISVNPEIKNEAKDSLDDKKTINSDSIFFKVQVAISNEKKTLKPENFNGLADVEEIYLDNIYKYFVGNTTDYNKSIDIQRKVRQKIPDAFIVAFKNGKKINLKEALKEINH
ncbi:MAG TPA: N-acetylmuramoyl-L-alanine amidase [Bacteroidales bacterium]|nr:MAG: hypothetical protein A2W98_14180 [Bacteroidetes bacterium GWF2_33_38]OFY76518.1 MAG: hypothetical protein A2265_09855 [Bacteroidetes bacterium RIFOXYA12_FULL_33_9]OFY85345.1 MAG: hypothetical protein A2236_06890 [Bacteroidetes bacterium RIFOXYA2_FULL_33_7]HBF89272.1 N-acetylmuramoyl-L-alanine amidase [Bacteroidales bacterium]